MSKTVTLEQLLESARKSEALSVQIAQAAQAELEKRPTSTEVNEAMDQLFTSVSDGKSLIASAITDRGVATAADASFQTMRENILAIESGGSLPEGVYQINVSASTAEGGTVSGGGVASEGMTLTVSANVADGYNFEGWQENGEVVSADNPYTFTVSGDKMLVATFEAIPSSILPEGYTELQYIETDNKCCISTGVRMFYSKTVLDIDITPYNYTSKNEDFFRASGYSSADYVGVSRESESLMNYRWHGSTGRTINKDVSNKRMHIGYDGPSNIMYIGDDKFPISTSNSNSAYDMAIFTSLGSPRSKLYGVTVKYEDTEVANFVPCMNPSGTIGLYDIVQNIFFENIGTGTLTAGPAV